jgi:hypothetical protein
MHEHDQDRISVPVEGTATSRQLHIVSGKSKIQTAEFPLMVEFWGAILALLSAGWLLLGCSALAKTGPAMPGGQAPGPIFRIETFQEERILALDPERITDSDVKELLSKMPAPRIFSFKGTAVANMESFGNFMNQMGYPDEKLRNPQTGKYSYSLTWSWLGCTCFECADMVGALAWYYEKEGMVPMLVGHSGGGVEVYRILYGLAGADRINGEAAYVEDKGIPVWNPVTGRAEPRYVVHDPVTGTQRRLSDLRVPYATMLATDKVVRLVPGFPGCHADIEKLPYVPDSVEDFTGFYESDSEQYQLLLPAKRSTNIRNVRLPSEVNHIGAFNMDGLAQNAQVRAWINAYRPGIYDAPPKVMGLDTSNIIHAADIWYSVKKHWCLEAKRLILAHRDVAKNPAR